MRRMLVLWASVTILATPASASTMVAPAPLTERLVTSAVVVVGTVSAIEEKTVEAGQAVAAKEKSAYQVAVVKIEDALTGAQGLTSIRVGFVPARAVAAPVGGIRRPVMPRAPHVDLAVGQEALFFLNPHHEKDFYIAPLYYHIVDKRKTESFDKDVAFLKRCVKLLAEPASGLKSQDLQERRLTAGLLITRYRTPPAGPGPFQQEPIDAEQSRLLLETLADADWKTQEPRTELPLAHLFGRLNPTLQDGWKPGPFQNYAVEFPAAAQKWLKEHAGSYRIQRYLPEKK